MSAAAARRRKQLAKKAALQTTDGIDPITKQLNTLLSTTNVDSNGILPESTAYEALQLAQSQLRKCVKSGEYDKATGTYGHSVIVTLLEYKKAAVASQLMTLLVQTLVETHTECMEEWIGRIGQMQELYGPAVEAVESKIEQRRLMRLQAKFLKGALGWSADLGSVRYGACELQKLLGDHYWSMAEIEAKGGEASEVAAPAEEDEEKDDFSLAALYSEAVTHLAMAEQPEGLLAKLKTLPDPTAAETKAGHDCPPSVRDSCLTRAILAMVTVENIRDAYTLLTSYLTECESRPLDELKTSYVNKKDGKAPSHVVFLSMLLSMVLKDKKTGPLYTWLLKSFNSELNKMHKPEMIKAYTSKIGRVYFDIMPPPSMLSTLENMMGMMGGGGLGGPGGMGGMNPAMMQAMMQNMGNM